MGGVQLHRLEQITEPEPNNSTNPGTVVSVRGSVVDIRFEEHLPPSYSVPRAAAPKRARSSFLPGRKSHVCFLRYGDSVLRVKAQCAGRSGQCAA